MYHLEWFIVACLVVTTGKEAFGQMKPFNSVTMIGGEAIFNCSGSLFIPNWIMSKDGSITNQVPIAGSCNVDPSLQNHYKTEKIGGPYACNLIVFNMTMDQAGVYWCTDGVPSYALLTVLDSFPTITYNNTPDVMEGENVVITCTLNYSGSVEPAPTLRPYFYWTDNTGSNVSNVYNAPPTNNSVVSQLTVTAGREDIMPYTCHVYLQLIPSVTVGYATNTPSVDSSASSPIITVLYPVETISISSTVPTEDNCVSKLETLTCTAKANPQAQYKWLDMNNNITITGAAMSISSGGEYQCIASNSIRSQTYSEKKTVTEINCYSPYNLTIYGTNCENNFCTCNGNASYAEQISITCMANGIPIPSVEWRSDNSFDGLNETIAVAYDGNYSCIATNRYGGNPHSAGLTVVVSDCIAPPTKLTTTSLSTSSATTVCSSSTNHCDATADAAIAMGVLFGISLVANVGLILLVIVIRRQNSSKRKANIPEPQIPYHSETFPPAAYEELRPTCNDGIHLQPTTYEQLTHRPPLYVNHVS